MRSRSLAERDVVRQLLDYLAAEHKFAIRLNTGTMFASYQGRTRAIRTHNLGPGVADILVVPPGALWCECKAPGGRQEPSQRMFQEWVEEHGHRYVLTHSVDDLAGLL